jgi:hypothetical protein
MDHHPCRRIGAYGHGSTVLDRLISCEHDLAPPFGVLAAVVEAACWRRDEVATALVNLADNHVLGLLARKDGARRIAAAIEEARKGELWQHDTPWNSSGLSRLQVFQTVKWT